MRLPPLTLLALEDNQSSARARTHLTRLDHSCFDGPWLPGACPLSGRGPGYKPRTEQRRCALASVFRFGSVRFGSMVTVARLVRYSPVTDKRNFFPWCPRCTYYMESKASLKGGCKEVLRT